MLKTTGLRLLLIFIVTLMLTVIGTSAQPIPRTTDLQIAAGYNHTCGIHLDDLLRCWGDNSEGQTDVPVDLGTVRAVRPGKYHTCAIKTDNTLRCWGDNFYGQSTVPGDVGTVLEVDTGKDHTCVIKTDNTLRCWGDNFYGHSTPPGDLGTVLSVSLGDSDTCAVKTDNTLRCWGYNFAGQTDVPVDLGTVSAVTAGNIHTCALKTDNTVRCWGYDDNGRTVVPPDLGTVLMVSAGDRHTCAVKTDSTVRCWGVPAAPVDLGTVNLVSAGNDHGCAVKTDNTVRCWGNNFYGQSRLPTLVTMDLIGSPLAEAGGVATLTLNTADYPWTNMVVNLAYSGTATGEGVDYAVSTSQLVFAITDLTASMTLTGIVDSESEGDETIIVDIDTVDGGIENDSQQVTAIIEDDDVSATPTPTEPASGTELVANGEFEAALAPWVVKNESGDKIKCDKPDKPVARSGICAFRFKGAAGENSKLQQLLDLTDTTFTPGDNLLLEVFANASNTAVNGKVKMSVKYSDDTAKCKINLSLVTTDGYEILDSNCDITSAAVAKIKLQVKHLSSVGKVYVDDVSVIHSGTSAASLISLP